MANGRESWDAYFMRIVDAVASRATCTRKKNGAVIIRGHFILSTGYNGSVRGGKHCDEVGCKMFNGHCVRTVHAEQNALVSAALNGVNISGAALYTTCFPCLICAKLLINSGIKKIFYREFYFKNEYKQEMEFTQELFKEAGVETIQMKE